MRVPNFISAAASRGIRYHNEGYAGPGVTDQTIDEARILALGSADDDKIIRANAWAARHAIDLEVRRNHDPSDPGYPGPGAVAHMLWGIQPTSPDRARDWYSRTSRQIQQRRKADQAQSVANALRDFAARLSNHK